MSIPGSRFLFVVNGIGRLGAHPQPTPPLFESLTLCAITIVGDCPGQAERSRPPTGSLSKTRGPGSLSAPSSPAQMRDLVGYCAEDVEKNVVDDKDGPWAYGKETEENLLSLLAELPPGWQRHTKSRIIHVSRPAKLWGRMENQDMLEVGENLERATSSR